MSLDFPEFDASGKPYALFFKKILCLHKNNYQHWWLQQSLPFLDICINYALKVLN